MFFHNLRYIGERQLVSRARNFPCPACACLLGVIFSAQHGPWNRTVPIGARVASLKPDGRGDKAEVFAEGWLIGSDDDAGTYRITYEGCEGAMPPR